MAFVIASENLVNLVWYLGFAINVSVVLMVLQILAYRGIVVFRECRRGRVEKIWQPILLASVEAVPADIPRLKRAEAEEFMTLWNYLHESLRDEALENLNRAARLAGADAAARRLLLKRNTRRRLLAMTTLGNLRDRESWGALGKFVNHRNAVVSLTAARGLMRIDPEKAIEIVMPLVAGRTDWSLEAVAAMLKKAGADIISLPLAKAIVASCRRRAAVDAPTFEQTNPTAHVHAPRLVYLLRLAHPRFVTYVVRYALLATDDIEIIAAALKVYDDPAILPAVREMLQDSRWQVRVNAAQAIGRTGTSADERLLINALRDEEWWVRYRAAQALANLPSVDAAKLEEYAAAQTSEFSRDILRQVAAERRFLSS